MKTNKWIAFRIFKRKNVLFISLLFFSTFYANCQDILVRELVKIDSVQMVSDSMSFIQPMRFKLTDDAIYVSDQLLNAIIKLDKQGNILAYSDQKGQGPAEFINPTYFDLNQEKFYLLDNANSRIQVFSTNLQHQGSFRIVRNNYSDINLNQENLLLFRYIPREEDKGKDASLSLVEMDLKGNIQREFGESLEVLKGRDITPSMYESAFEIYEDKIFVLPRYYPFLQVYSQSGELEREITLSLKEQYDQSIPRNYGFENLKKGKRSYGIDGLFQNIVVNKEGIYILLMAPRKYGIIIDHYDFEGMLIERFHYALNETESYFLNDFTFEESTGNFYIMYQNPIPQLGIFKTSSVSSEEKSTPFFYNKFYLLLFFIVGLFILWWLFKRK